MITPVIRVTVVIGRIVPVKAGQEVLPISLLPQVKLFGLVVSSERKESQGDLVVFILLIAGIS